MIWLKFILISSKYGKATTCPFHTYKNIINNFTFHIACLISILTDVKWNPLQQIPSLWFKMDFTYRSRLILVSLKNVDISQSEPKFIKDSGALKHHKPGKEIFFYKKKFGNHFK